MISQTAILVFGILSAWFYNSRHESARKWGPIVSAFVQPFWLYATWAADQMGMFALSIYYCAMTVRGIRAYWFAAK